MLIIVGNVGDGACRVIVGAPRDNVTDGGSAAERLVRPGAVYQCPFTSSASDCEPVIIDREGRPFLPTSELPEISAGAATLRIPWDASPPTIEIVTVR